MAKWKVFKYVKAGGRCPIDEWYNSKQLTLNDRAAFDNKLESIEGIEGKLPPEWLKKYKTSSLYEIKIKGDKKALRPLCALVNNRVIILLVGIVKKSKHLPKGDVEKAEGLKREMEDGYGSVKRYDQD